MMDDQGRAESRMTSDEVGELFDGLMAVENEALAAIREYKTDFSEIQRAEAFGLVRSTLLLYLRKLEDG